MNLIQKLACSVGLLAFASSAGAASGNVYQSSVAGTSYSVTANWQGSTTPPVNGNLEQSQQMRELVNTAQAYYLSIESGMNDAVGAAMIRLSQSNLQARLKYPGALAGQLAGSLARNPGGDLHLAISGINYSAALGVSGSEGLLNFDCNVGLEMGDLRFGLDFNPTTGTSSNKTSSSATPTHTVSCTNSFGWLPWIGKEINRRIEELIRSKINGGFDIGASVLHTEPQRALFAFVNSIQPNTLMLGPIDVGMYIQNNIRNLYLNHQVTLTVAKPSSFYAPTRNHIPSPLVRSGNAVSFDFYENGVKRTGFRADLARRFNWTLISGTGDD